MQGANRREIGQKSRSISRLKRIESAGIETDQQNIRGRHLHEFSYLSDYRISQTFLSASWISPNTQTSLDPILNQSNL